MSNLRILIFRGKTTFIAPSKETAADFLDITVRTLNRHLADGTPLRKGGWFFDETIEYDDLNVPSPANLGGNVPSADKSCQRP